MFECEIIEGEEIPKEKASVAVQTKSSKKPAFTIKNNHESHTFCKFVSKKKKKTNLKTKKN